MITKHDIETAYALIRDHVVRTPVVYSHTLSKLCGCETLFKLENLQMTGAFKERGALHKLLNLSAAERATGVSGVAGSSGQPEPGSITWTRVEPEQPPRSVGVRRASDAGRARAGAGTAGSP